MGWLKRVGNGVLIVVMAVPAILLIPVCFVVACAGYTASYLRFRWLLRRARVGEVYTYNVATGAFWQGMDMVPLPSGRFIIVVGCAMDPAASVEVCSSNSDAAHRCVFFFAQTAYPSASLLTVKRSWPCICDLMNRHASFRKAASDLDAAARTLQRAWRRSRDRRRRRAVLVISMAALNAMYRPGGWRYGSVAGHWDGLANMV